MSLPPTFELGLHTAAAASGGAGVLLASALSGLLLRASHIHRMQTDLAQLLDGLPVVARTGTPKSAITGLTADSRRVGPGYLFFALPGTRLDGSTFIEDALGRGAAAVIVGSPVRVLQPGACLIQVEDLRAVLAEVARRFYGHPEKQVSLLGVTGTNGKTTTTYLVRHLLAEPETPMGLIGTVEYHLGKRALPAHRTTPDALEITALLAQMREAGCRRCVMEVSSHSLDQQRVQGLPMAVAAFTNLTQDHLDYHGTMEAYYQAKKKLFTGEVAHLPGRAVINLDDTWGQRLAGELEGSLPVWTYGEGAGATFHASEVELDDRGTRFVLAAHVHRLAVATPLLGRYNLQNTLTAIAMATAIAGIEALPRLVARLASFPGVPGRMERIYGGQPFTVVVDYAHTDDALTNALSMLRTVTPGRLFCVFGCGGNRDRAKRPKMTRAVQAQADFAFATADNPRREALTAIFDDMRTGVTKADRIAFLDDRRRAISVALDACKPGDCLLIAGKGHETYQEFADTVVPFDDRAVARELLSLKGYGPTA